MMSTYAVMRIKDVLRTRVVLCVWMWTDNMHDCVHHLHCWVLSLSGLRFALEMKRNEGPLRVSLEKLFYILMPFRLVWCDLDCTGQWVITIMATSLFEPDTKSPVQLQGAAKDTWQKDIRRSHLFTTVQTVVNKVCAGSRWNRSTMSPLLRLLLTKVIIVNEN